MVFYVNKSRNLKVFTNCAPCEVKVKQNRVIIEGRGIEAADQLPPKEISNL